MSPRVTVAITTYNRAALLARTLESVLGSTLSEFELFVSDNGSTDDTARVVEEFAGRDSRVRYAPLERNFGPHANFTRSLTLGTAPYVALVQDDDLFLPENLARKVELLDAHPDMVFAHSAFQYIDADDRVVVPWANWSRLRDDTIEPGPEFIRLCVIRGARVNHSSAVLRRAAVDGESFDPADGRPCDYGFFMRVARRGSVGFLADALTAVRRHEGSDTVQAGTMVLDDGVYKPDFEVIRGVRHARDRFLARYGDELVDASRTRAEARQWVRRDLAGVVLRRTEPRRGPVATVKLLARAARIEPSLLVSREGARVVAGSLAGERGRARWGYDARRSRAVRDADGSGSGASVGSDRTR
jgi:glycosyltransferase involved in cell wall biosynthesis